MFHDALSSRSQLKFPSHGPLGSDIIEIFHELDANLIHTLPLVFQNLCITLHENRNSELFPLYYKALPSVVHPNIVSLEEGSGHITLDTKFTIQD